MFDLSEGVLFFIAGAIITGLVILSVQTMKKINWCENHGLVALKTAHGISNIVCVDPKILVKPDLKEKT